jgi:MFS family permease
MSEAPATPEPAARELTPGYANYVLGVLFVVYVFNFIDRQILSILLQSIKEDLGATDTQLGFLTGTAFAIFYTFAGIPLARWADRGVRRDIITLGLALWSAMTAASGLARSFWQLAAARIGVGVGEAACSPPAHSLIADYFPPERRSTALSIYAMGIHVGIMFGYLAGGWIDEFFGWRVAFFVVGLPGLGLAVLLRWSVREPPRGHSEGVSVVGEVPSLAEARRTLWRLRSFRQICLAGAFMSFAGYGVAIWAPVFLVRVHGMGTGEIGTWLGLITGFAGPIGAFLGGRLTDRFGSGDARWYGWLPAGAALLSLPFAAFFLLWPDPRVALAVSFFSTLLGAMWLGPTFSIVQGLVGLRMRSMASAILLFVFNLIGLGLGPQSVGILNDQVFAGTGEEAIRWSLLSVVVVMNLWAAVHFLLAARSLRRDLAVPAP